MSKLRQSAKGMPCTLQLECCNHWDYKDILRGHLRTMDIWVKQGLIKI